MHTTRTFDTALQQPRPSFAPWFRGIVMRLIERLAVWHERSRQRYHLATLDDHILKDIGLSRADVTREIDKPFWRP
jgi:uncharacterized protein YjiS (DUF1127 family)